MPLTRKLVLSKTFEKSYQKFSGKNQALKDAIGRTLAKLENDAFEPSLRTHKLSGKLVSYLACSCGYDCRIIFMIERLTDSSDEYILLLNIGNHDDVY